MVTEDDRRWSPGLHNLPRRNGKLKEISQFDAELFHFNPSQAHAMDPQLRLLFKVTYEAIIDADYNPLELKGSQTGVFVGNMFMETWMLQATRTQVHILGMDCGVRVTLCCQTRVSDRISTARYSRTPYLSNCNESHTHFVTSWSPTPSWLTTPSISP